MASTLTSFTSGDLVISIVGDGDGSGNYTDNQASPITLEELTTSGTVVGQLVLPQQTVVVNGTTEYAVSGEYGSSSEGTIQLAANGQSIVIGGYGVNAATFNAGGATVYGNAALAQSTSLTTSNYTPVARVVADIGYNATIDSSTALYNIYNTNNPRSISTVNGTSFYLSGQGVKGDPTQGVFTATDGGSSATAIDTSTDTRTAEIVNGVLYVSRDSTQGTGGTSNIASYGTTLPTSATTDTPLSGITGKVALTAGQANSVNGAAVGTSVNLSPENFFFANATTLYVADGGNPKEGGLGDGGLQKWSLVGGTWVLDYTLSTGLNLVADTNSSGSTGLIGLTGVVSGGTVQLFATNSTLGDLDQTYLYTITDTLSATTLPTSESFTVLATAAADTNIRGISFAPSAPTTTPTNVPVASGMTSSGITVTSGSTVTVAAGGFLTSATVLSAGSATVSGTDTSTIIGQGGTETLLGSATGDVVEGTQIVSAATAVVSNEVVNNGGALDLYLKGAVASNTTVFTGGSLNISGNATAIGTIISGGLVSLQSPKAVLSGSITFAGAGTIQVTSATSAGYGDLAVISGFGTGDVVDTTTLAYAGATLSTAVVSGNTVATVTNGAVSATYTFAGSVASSLKLVGDTLATPGAEIAYAAPVPTPTVVASGVISTGNTITSGSTLTVSSGGTLISGTIQSGVALGSANIFGTDSGTTIQAGGNEVVLGTAVGDQIYGIQLVSAATAAVSNETVFNGGALDLFLKGSVATGTVVSSGGTLAISGNAVASNTTLAGGATIALQSPKATLSGAVILQGTNDTILITGAISAGYGDSATISGFVTGDTIDIATFGTGAAITSLSSGGNTVVTVSSGTGSQSSEAFVFAGAYSSSYFSLTPDGNGGQQINAVGTPCYCPGTLIETPAGEVAVETLAIGDRVTTASGQQRPIKWIGRRAYGSRFAAGKKHILPVRFAAGSLGAGLPKRDLMVSPLHAMFIDEVLIPASALVNGVSIVQLERVESVEYIHIELDSHDVLLAEGAPSESFVDDQSRGMFHNAGEYDRLYPDTAIEPARYCAPRLEDGEEVEAVRRRLAAIAAPAASFGNGIEGCLDEASRGRIRGWARDGANPGQPVLLQIVVDGEVFRTILADTFRADLLAAGIGDGRHAFDVTIPGGLSPDATHVIDVRRADDGAALAQRLCA